MMKGDIKIVKQHIRELLKKNPGLLTEDEKSKAFSRLKKAAKL